MDGGRPLGNDAPQTRVLEAGLDRYFLMLHAKTASSKQTNLGGGGGGHATTTELAHRRNVHATGRDGLCRLCTIGCVREVCVAAVRLQRATFVARPVPRRNRSRKVASYGRCFADTYVPREKNQARRQDGYFDKSLVATHCAAALLGCRGRRCSFHASRLLPREFEKRLQV